MFANKRIERVKTLTMYEINSIVTRRGTIIKGTPLGKNNAKNFTPCILIPIIFIPIKIDKAKPNVNAIWLLL
jgi:hypothetical protein